MQYNKNRKYSSISTLQVSNKSTYQANSSQCWQHSFPTHPQNQPNQYTHPRKRSADLHLLQDINSGNYKTEVCKYWENSGVCPFGNECIFAHGGSQMRSKDGQSCKYKTKHCKNFYHNSYCPYGKRCQFIHDDNKSVMRVKDCLLYYWFGKQAIIDSKTVQDSRCEGVEYSQTKSKNNLQTQTKSNRLLSILNPEPLMAGYQQKQITDAIERRKMEQRMYIEGVLDSQEYREDQYFVKPRLYSL